MALRISERHAWVLQSEIRNMSMECSRVGGVNLSQGVCDTEVPLVVRQGAQEAIDQDVNTYTRFDGLEELREAIAHKKTKVTGMEVDPERDYYEGLARQYRVKRDMICHGHAEVCITPFIPQGAYYVLADASMIPGDNSRDKAMYLLRNTGVASVPGSAFFHNQGEESLVRFCFAKENHIIENACNRLYKLRI